MSGPLLISGGRVLTDVRTGTVENVDVLVRDGTIVAVGPDLERGDAEVVDAQNRLVMPGLVDSHKHTWQSSIRHRTTGIDLFAYFGDVFGRLGSTYTPDDVYVGTLLGAVAALEAGTTTLMDWSHVQNSPSHSDAAIRALADAGIRAVFGHGWPLVDLPSWIQGSTLPHTEDVRRIRTEVLADDDALVTMALAGRGPELSTMEVTTRDLAMARDLGIRTSIHMGCGKGFGEMAAIAQMNDAGLLGPDLTFVHCSESSDDELRMMADHGVSGSVSPQHEQAWPGIGPTPIDRFRGLGVRTGLSTDSESFGASDMFAQAKMALGAVRSHVNAGLSRFEDAPSTFGVNDVLAMATIDAAAVLGLEHRTGSIEVGKAADLVLIRADDLNLHPVVEPVAAIVNAAHPGNVDTVIVDGVVRKRDGQLIGIDLDRIRHLAEQSQHRVLGF
ncbi:amidohydrolase family protein [Rhodococcus fascians]|nr:amidohydrolase family protein [Rhodococcus fascians]MBY4116489.1 amidohydrolase family protein [Rhodococcus fascians]